MCVKWAHKYQWLFTKAYHTEVKKMWRRVLSCLQIAWNTTIHHCKHWHLRVYWRRCILSLEEFQLNSVIYRHLMCLSFPGCVRFFVSPKRSALVRWTRATLGGPWRLRRRLHKSASITHRRPACNLFSCAAGANKLARLLCTPPIYEAAASGKTCPSIALSLCAWPRTALSLLLPRESINFQPTPFMHTFVCSLALCFFEMDRNKAPTCILLCVVIREGENDFYCVFICFSKVSWVLSGFWNFDTKHSANKKWHQDILRQ